MSSEPVVITGIGVVSSIGIGRDEFFDALLAGRSGVRTLRGLTEDIGFPDDRDVSKIPDGLLVGAPITNFNGKEHIKPRKAIKVMCREIQTTFAASQLAIDSAALRDHLPLDPDTRFTVSDIGAVFGSEMFVGSPAEMEDAVVGCRDESGRYDTARFGGMAMKKVVPLWMLKYLPNMPACHVGISIGAQGPNNSLVLGEISGPAAMMEGISYLDREIAKVMLTGAAGTRVNPTRLNYRGGLPTGDLHDRVEFSSRPFDPASRGVIGGEAAVCVVLEPLSAVEQRDAPAIAKVDAVVSRFVSAPKMRLGGAEAHRGSRQAIELAIRGALEKAEITPDQVGAIISQATGENAVDAAESQAISSVLPGIPITAPVAAVGHTGAATGGVNVVVGAMVIERGQIPPTVLAGDRQPLEADLVRQATPLIRTHVVCLSHTPEGSAMATVLSNSR